MSNVPACSIFKEYTYPKYWLLLHVFYTSSHANKWQSVFLAFLIFRHKYQYLKSLCRSYKYSWVNKIILPNSYSENSMWLICIYMYFIKRRISLWHKNIPDKLGYDPCSITYVIRTNKSPEKKACIKTHIVSTNPCMSQAIRIMTRFLVALTYSISQEICTRFLLCCALLWLYIDWFSHIHQAYFTGTVAI